MNLEKMGIAAKSAARSLMVADEELKNKALHAIADALEANTDRIVSENEKDLKAGAENGLPSSMLDRLKLDAARIKGIADAARDVADLKDPVGEVLETVTRPNGLEIQRVRVPMGVVGMIYEARPNVTVDAACLCLKSGNAAILRGGKEAICSNIVLEEIMRDAIKEAGLPHESVQLIRDTSRESATAMMRMNGYLDVLIPRGGAGLIRAVVENASVPVIETAAGNCHIYVDKDADFDMAAKIVENAKVSRVSVCNACESLLVHRDAARDVLPMIAERLSAHNVEIRGDEATCDILPDATPATEQDWATEYLDYIISCRVVDDLAQATAHIAKYSTGHSECIITENKDTAKLFCAAVDSAAVYVNASTRFTDGGEFGFGAEIGISTQKLHARGPMALREMTSYKYVVYGDGQIR